MATSDSQISQGEIFDLLSNPRRRFVINYLLRENRPVSIQELSRELAKWEFGVDDEELTDKQEKRIYVALYQTHIPKLEDFGVVEYDSDASLVELTDEVTRLQPYIEESRGDERPWPWYYLGIVAVGLPLFFAAQFEVAAATQVAPSLVGLATMIALVGLAVFHYAETAT
jgi:hypothetical protein